MAVFAFGGLIKSLYPYAKTPLARGARPGYGAFLRWPQFSLVVFCDFPRGFWCEPMAQELGSDEGFSGVQAKGKRPSGCVVKEKHLHFSGLLRGDDHLCH